MAACANTIISINLILDTETALLTDKAMHEQNIQKCSTYTKYAEIHKGVTYVSGIGHEPVRNHDVAGVQVQVVVLVLRHSVHQNLH